MNEYMQKTQYDKFIDTKIQREFYCEGFHEGFEACHDILLPLLLEALPLLESELSRLSGRQSDLVRHIKQVVEA